MAAEASQIEQDIKPEARRAYYDARLEALRTQYVAEEQNLEVFEDNAAARRADLESALKQEREGIIGRQQRLSSAYQDVKAKTAALPAP